MSEAETAARPDDLSQSLRRIFPQLSRKLDLRRQLGTIKADLEKIEERIRFQEQEFDPGISGYVSYALDSNGKRIRPALVLLAARASGESRPRISTSPWWWS
jgi:hypothetical protein